MAFTNSSYTLRVKALQAINIDKYSTSSTDVLIHEVIALNLFSFIAFEGFTRQSAGWSDKSHPGVYSRVDFSSS